MPVAFSTFLRSNLGDGRKMIDGPFSTTILRISGR